MQRRQRWGDLPNDPRDDRRMETFAELSGWKFGQTLSGHMHGDQRQVVFVQVHDRANLRKRRMAESRQALNAFTQGVVEAWTDRELALESQQLQRDGVGVVEHQQPIAESIASSWSVTTGEPWGRFNCGKVRVVHRHGRWRSSLTPGACRRAHFMRILCLRLSGVVGSRENELELILHETTPESRTNQRPMHTALMLIIVHLS